MLRTATPLAVIGFAAVLSGCPGQQGEQQEKPRGAVTITEKDIVKGQNTITRQMGFACTPGKRVVVEAEITGNVKGAGGDSVIAEALCDNKGVAQTQVTAKPPIGFDANKQPGTQTSGPAACRANWIFIGGANQPVFKVTCTFY